MSEMVCSKPLKNINNHENQLDPNNETAKIDELR
jgi:hypothetical protein